MDELLLVDEEMNVDLPTKASLALNEAFGIIFGRLDAHVIFTMKYVKDGGQQVRTALGQLQLEDF